MRRIVWTVVLLGLCLASVEGRGQDAGARARELAAHFNKDKHKIREKNGVHLEVFLEMRGEPAARKSPADYSGAYESDPEFAFELRVGADGSADGRGTEPAADGVRRFTLRGARVSGALLSGTKVYENGATEPLEAVFIDLTVRHSPNETGTTTFGLGVVFDPPQPGDGYEIAKLFYALKP